MMSKKKNRNIYVITGYLLIILGLSLPLYGFFNMSYNNITEDKNYEEYVAENKTPDPIELEGIEEYNKKIVDNYIVDPFENEDYKAEYDFYRQHPDKIFAYLTIPTLDIKQPIYLDASYDHMDRGVAHVDGTSLPVGGINTRSVIAGHRGRYTDLMFFNLHLLEKGDLVIITKDGKEMKYEVSDEEVIYPNEWEKLQPRPGEDMITLLTCEPLAPPRPQRLLINCTRVIEKPEEEIETKKSIKEHVREEIKEDTKDKVDNSIKNLNLLIKVITILLMGLLLFTIYKLIRYLF